MTKFNSEAERETALRDETDRKNRQELGRLMDKHGLFIRQSELDDWRPTVEETGDIPGVRDSVTIIATNGIVAYFLLPDDFDVLFGHIQKFTGEVRTKFSMPKDKPTKERKPATLAEKALKLLQETQARFAQKA